MSDKYEKLKKILAEKNFPMVYPFKFIIKKDLEKQTRIKLIFDETAEFDVRQSRNGKYHSITIKQMMLSPEEIIMKYKAMEKIEGIISL